MKNIVLQAKNLNKTFKNEGVTQEVLRNMAVEMYEGDFTVIMGPSGAGKSTLMYSLSGMDRPTSGEVLFESQNIARYSDDKLAIFRRKNCGFVFQQMCLIDNMSVMDNVVASGLLVQRNKKEIEKKAMNLFLKVNIDEKIWRKTPNRLSGGEAQRAAIVRALINDPSVVFADEPTGALNSSNSKSVLDILTVVNRIGQTVVMVTHDITSAERGQRVIYMKDGIICGECVLGTYTSEDKGRRGKIKEFLQEMGW